MKLSKNIAAVITLSVLFVFGVSDAFADKTYVTIEAPAKVKAGTEITIRINVFHNGNNSFHHTDLVYLKIDGKEVKKWEFSSKNKPESENFTVEFKYTVEKPIEIVAEAICNIHGSKGPATFKVEVE